MCTFIPNVNNYEIDNNIEGIFEFQKKFYKFEENKYFKDLRLIEENRRNYCVMKNNCKLNKDVEISELHIHRIIIEKAINIHVYQTCYAEDITLNYLIL